MRLINSEITEFSLDAFRNGEFLKISKSDTIGKWAIFVFYPADFTFVCPTELGDIADHYDEIKSLDAEVYGVSTDSHFCHKAWWDSSETINRVQYALISDNLFNLSES
jgi:peroxiredoxin (alkyl hydroperoxide reductase subunit C)